MLALFDFRIYFDTLSYVSTKLGIASGATLKILPVVLDRGRCRSLIRVRSLIHDIFLIGSIKLP